MRPTQTGRLRVQPVIAQRVISLLTGATGTDVAELVEADPALCAVLLRAANATHLGFPRRIGGVRQATVMLGQDATTALAIARTADLVFDEDAPEPNNWFWPHAVATAAAAAALARRTDQNVEFAYTAGLLHNIAELLDDTEGDHAIVGAELLERWNLPEPIVSAVQHHHRKFDSLVAPLDRIVAAARVIAAQTGVSDGSPVAPIADALRLVGLSVNRPEVITAEVERALTKLVRLAGPP